MAGKKRSQQTGRYSKSQNPLGLSRRGEMNINRMLDTTYGYHRSLHEWRRERPQAWQDALQTWNESLATTPRDKAFVKRTVKPYLPASQQNYPYYMISREWEKLTKEALALSKNRKVPNDVPNYDGTTYYTAPSGQKVYLPRNDPFTGYDKAVDSNTQFVKDLARVTETRRTEIADLINQIRTYNSLDRDFRRDLQGDYAKLRDRLDDILSDHYEELEEDYGWNHAEVWDMISGYSRRGAA